MSTIDDFLLQFSGEKIAYFPNPGNAGDSVIAAATYQAFRRNNIEWHLPRHDLFDPKGKIIFYGGGGNLIATSTYSARVVHKLNQRADRLVVLPHTIKNIDPILNELGNNVDLFCRERYSHAYVKNSGTRANVYLADDMAFGLDLPALKKNSRPNPGLEILKYGAMKFLARRSTPTWKNLRRSLDADAIADRLRKIPKASHLNCFRLDGERTGIPIPEDNIDLSQEFEFGLESATLAEYCASRLIEFLGEYDGVNTNRLHIAISAALAGLQVKFYANSYYKCKGVFEFSMKDRYGNVEWMSS